MSCSWLFLVVPRQAWVQLFRPDKWRRFLYWSRSVSGSEKLFLVVHSPYYYILIPQIL